MAARGPAWFGRDRAMNVLEHTAMGMVLVLWLFEVTPAAGGRDRGPLQAGIGALVGAILILRPWRRLPGITVLLPALAGGGALWAISTTAPAWSHSAQVAWTLAGALALLAVGGYARTEGRRSAVALAVMLAGAVEFAQALVPWWGGGDPNELMWGTFYWHNQFAAYLLGAAIVAIAAFVHGPRVLRIPGAVVAGLCSAGVLFSTSRTVLSLLVLGWVMLTPLRRTRAGLTRWAAVPLIGAGWVWLLSGPLLFPAHRYVFPLLRAEGGRGTGTLRYNGDARWSFTQAALRSWRQSPWTGHGFGSFQHTGVDFVPAGLPISVYVHNGPVEWLTSGGLLYATPLVVGLMALTYAAVRAGARSAGHPERYLRRALAVALFVLLVHSCVDFDWTYPSLSVLFGALAGLLVGFDRPNCPGTGAATPRRVGLWVVGLPLLAGIVFLTSWGDGASRAWSRTSPSSASAPTLLVEAARWPRDPDRAAIALLALLPDLRHGGPNLMGGVDAARAALRQTAGVAGIEPQVAAERDLIMIGLGDIGAGRAALEQVVRRDAPHRPYLYGDLVVGRAMMGDFAGAYEALSLISRATAGDNGSAGQVALLQSWLERVRRMAACASGAARSPALAPRQLCE